MDDTAVSKVRDPSASIRLGPEGDLIDVNRAEPAVPAVVERPRVSMTSLLLGGGFGVAIVGVAVLFTQLWREDSAPVQKVSRPADSARPKASAPTPTTLPAKQSAPASCALAHPAKKLASAVASVPPVVAANGREVAVGYAKIPGQAMGLLVAPGTLQAEVTFREWKREVVSHVFPVHDADGSLEFAVHRGVYRAFEETTLPQSPGARVRATPTGVVLIHEGRPAETLWPLAAEGVSKVSAVASGDGYVVVIVTKAPAAVFTGLLDASGHAASPLEPAPGIEQPLDATVTTNGNAALLFVRSRTESGQKLQVASWSAGAGAAEPVVLEGIERATSAGDLAASALPDGGWWLQWTERGPGGATVVGVPVSSSLELGERVVVSDKGQAHSVGAVAVGSDVVSVFATPSGARRLTLWTAAAGCE